MENGDDLSEKRIPTLIERIIHELHKRLNENKKTKSNLLDLSYCFIREIPDLSEYVWVKELELQGNQIDNIKKECLPPKLESININNNRVEKLMGSDFPDTLTELFARQNKIDYFDVEGFENLTSLDIYGNTVGEFTFPPNIMELDISDNMLKELEDLPASLTVFIASNNCLSDLVPNDALSICDVSHNYITEPPIFATELVELDISYNKIEDYYDLPDNLEIFIAHNNNIRTMCTLPNKLKEINLAYNDLNDTEMEKMDLPNGLEKINLCNNSSISTIKGIPWSILEIDVRGTKIGQFTDNLVNKSDLVLKYDDHYADSDSSDEFEVGSIFDNGYSNHNTHSEWVWDKATKNWKNNNNYKKHTSSYNYSNYNNWSNVNWRSTKVPTFDFTRGKVSSSTNPNYIILRRKLVV